MDATIKYFDIIKSSILVKQILLILKPYKMLNIIKYNKSIQNRLKIGVNDYKYYFEKIIIEITIKRNINMKYLKNYFINIKKGYESFYHFYFDNYKKEIKRNYITNDEKAEKTKTAIDYEIKSLENLFDSCDIIETINFKQFNRKDITNMGDMFYGCSSLIELNLSNFKTDNVVNMGFMFYKCNYLKEINLSNFITDKVINMNNLFYECSSLESLNVLNFKTDNVETMKKMFFGCSSLKELNLSNFDTNNVTDMNGMFFGCSSLK